MSRGGEWYSKDRGEDGKKEVGYGRRQKGEEGAMMEGEEGWRGRERRGSEGGTGGSQVGRQEV